jgi:hypothetical protein
MRSGGSRQGLRLWVPGAQARERPAKAKEAKDGMTDSKRQIVYAAAYEDVTQALADLDALPRLYHRRP